MQTEKHPVGPNQRLDLIKGLINQEQIDFVMENRLFSWWPHLKKQKQMKFQGWFKKKKKKGVDPEMYVSISEGKGCNWGIIMHTTATHRNGVDLQQFVQWYLGFCFLTWCPKLNKNLYHGCTVFYYPVNWLSNKTLRNVVKLLINALFAFHC